MKGSAAHSDESLIKAAAYVIDGLNGRLSHGQAKLMDAPWHVYLAFCVQTHKAALASTGISFLYYRASFVLLFFTVASIMCLLFLPFWESVPNPLWVRLVSALALSIISIDAGLKLHYMVGFIPLLCFT